MFASSALQIPPNEPVAGKVNNLVFPSPMPRRGGRCELRRRTRPTAVLPDATFVVLNGLTAFVIGGSGAWLPWFRNALLISQ